MSKSGAKNVKKSAEGETSQAILVLPDYMDISNAAGLKELLLNECTKNPPSLCIDGEAVERMTTPAVQLVVAAALKIEKSGGVCKIRNASQSMRTSFAELGLSGELDSRS